MRGTDDHQDGLFSYVSLDARVPSTHPLRAVREMVDRALVGMSREFEAIYAVEGRPSIAPERLLRALLLQVFYSIRSERLLCEQLDYNLLFRCFAGLWGCRATSRCGITRRFRKTATVFSKPISRACFSPKSIAKPRTRGSSPMSTSASTAR